MRFIFLVLIGCFLSALPASAADSVGVAPEVQSSFPINIQAESCTLQVPGEGKPRPLSSVASVLPGGTLILSCLAENRTDKSLSLDPVFDTIHRSADGETATTTPSKEMISFAAKEKKTIDLSVPIVAETQYGEVYGSLRESTGGIASNLVVINYFLEDDHSKAQKTAEVPVERETATTPGFLKTAGIIVGVIILIILILLLLTKKRNVSGGRFLKSFIFLSVLSITGSSSLTGFAANDMGAQQGSSVSEIANLKDAVSAATVNVQNGKIVHQDGHAFTLTFDISNHLGVQGGIRYAVVASREGDGKQVEIDRYVSPSVLSLGMNEYASEEVVYTAPGFLVGEYALSVEAFNEAGFDFDSLSFGPINLTPVLASEQPEQFVPVQSTMEDSGLLPVASGAVVKNLLFDRDNYKKGDTAHLVFYRTTEKSKADLTPNVIVSIADGKGEICAPAIAQGIATTTPLVHVSTEIVKGCVDPRATIALQDVGGQILSEASFAVLTKEGKRSVSSPINFIAQISEWPFWQHPLFLLALLLPIIYLLVRIRRGMRR